MGFLAKLFGGGLAQTVENIALEAIETDIEKAEASSIFVKALDPNGNMRRVLSQFACVAYGFYLVSTTVLVFMHSFEFGNPVQSKEAIDAMTALFTPITTAWGAIVSASFGVNGVNSYKAK